MNLNLRGKHIIISGGAKGIGAVTTRLFLEEGAIPIILDSDEEAGNRLIGDLKSGEFIGLDLRDGGKCERAIASVIGKYGSIHVLVNNAGTNDVVGLTASREEFVASLDQNLVHYFTLTKLCWDSLKQSKGTVVNISSKVALVGQGNTSGYVAAKGAILALTREWAVEGLAHDIRVNAVLPAEVYTEMYEEWLNKFDNPTERKAHMESKVPLGKRMTTPEEIAKTIRYLASDMSSHTTGEFLSPDGGYVQIR
uniref:L-fucose dehydrogenase n=1 Tax=Candidatus Kentrum sp. LPFa TaxID=2126335 RepID=A0A450XT72_9GAMM|nr:MAG: L-fucose dehydrogenase [Candidatus Kentron sp. LPFa]VFK32479.1 MAG: L-fucose dehydrogenase [Candidatus Kentron sp. LPFa]